MKIQVYGILSQLPAMDEATLGVNGALFNYRADAEIQYFSNLLVVSLFQAEAARALS